MTPKDKAQELVGKFYPENIGGRNFGRKFHAKQCALIAVDEIIKTVNMCIPYQNEETYAHYWQDVKQEIEKL